VVNCSDLPVDSPDEPSRFGDSEPVKNKLLFSEIRNPEEDVVQTRDKMDCMKKTSVQRLARTPFGEVGEEFFRSPKLEARQPV
jgi:hypothetical protein